MIRVDFSLPVEFQEIPLGRDFDVAWPGALLPGERKPVATVSDAAGVLRSLRFTAVDGTTVNPADRAGDAHDGGGRP
ncbi:hypothetical protein [Streptomyces sp. NPDC002763]|uniref:hypothetical protein n=1 Tax=Streptomyces sp. NPDC002763 TaxID=3154427 RepID=UPI003334765D